MACFNGVNRRIVGSQPIRLINNGPSPGFASYLRMMTPATHLGSQPSFVIWSRIHVKINRSLPLALLSSPAHLTTPVVKTPLDSWLRSSTFEHRINGWLADHDVDQPVFKAPPHSRPYEIEKFREMVLILKLARRCRNPWPRASHTVEFGKGDERGFNLNHFYRQLTNPNAPEWATIDTDGSVLNFNNHSRLAQIFSGQHQTEFRHGRTILIHDNWQNRPLKAWLEEDPDYPRRPMAKLRFVNPQQDKHDRTMVDRTISESQTTIQ